MLSVASTRGCPRRPAILQTHLGERAPVGKNSTSIVFNESISTDVRWPTCLRTIPVEQGGLQCNSPPQLSRMLEFGPLSVHAAGIDYKWLDCHSLEGPTELARP